MPILLLIFIIIPIIEIVVFIYVGGELGIVNTIAIVIITAIIGTYMLQKQGLSVLLNAQNDLNEGKPPIGSVVDGIFLLIAGAFLLTPGLITDAIGFLLFVPQFRSFLAKNLANYFISQGNVKFYTDRPTDDRSQHDPRGPIIDAEYTNVEPQTAEKDIRQIENPSQSDSSKNSSPWKYK